MKILLVDASHYPCLEFPQLDIGLTVDETRVSIEDGDNVYSAPFFNSFYSFPSENLYGYDDDVDLLVDFAKKHGYDNFEYVK